MKFPSLQHAAAEAGRVFRRFPLTLLCSFILGGVGIYLIHNLDFQEADQLTWIFPILSTAGLGLSLTLATALAAERYQWPEHWRWTAQAGAVALLGIWYGLVPAQPNLVWGTRLSVLLVGLHLTVAAGPYLSELRQRADTPGFWRYNETLFLRILAALLYSGVLFAGCALALLAIEKLFNVKLDYRVYGNLLVLFGTVFNTWFFLAGVPHDFAALEHEAPYPKGLKLFTQFVLLPLVVLYLGILYAYMGRILVTWTLPEGWVSTLVLVLAVAGIFALLLIHPIRQTAENAWIRTFSRWFYRALFPLLALLAVAIGTRIQAYGITEERYFVLALAAWLFGMAVYFLRRHGVNIVWIPASLAVVAFLSAAGPWGAFAIAEHSQLRQLMVISRQHGLLQNGHLDAAGQRVTNLPVATRVRIESIFDFFASRNSVSQLQPLFTASLSLPDSLHLISAGRQQTWQNDRLFTLSNLMRADRYSEEQNSMTVLFRAKDSDIQSLGGGRYWINNISPSSYSEVDDKIITKANLTEGSFRLRTRANCRQLLLEQLRANGSWQTQLTLTPGAIADSLAQTAANNNEELPNRILTTHTATTHATLHLYIKTISRYQKRDIMHYSYDAQALLELKN